MSALASTSLSAYHSLDLCELEERVADVIAGFGIAGCISDQVRESLPTLSYSSVTARFTSLEEKGAIYRAGDTRKGESNRQQKVLRDIRYASAVPAVVTKRARSAFVSGMMFAAKTIVASDPAFKGTPGAMTLKFEIMKAARR